MRCSPLGLRWLPSVCFLVAAIVLLGVGRSGAQDIEDLRQVFRQFGRQVANPQLPGDESGEADGVDDSEMVLALPTKVFEIGDQEIRLHMTDGSIVTGELAVAELQVTTDFGSLVVPVNRVRSLRPGLQSYPELRAKLDGLIAGLSDAAYETREASQKELLGYGLQVAGIVRAIEPGDDAELKRRLSQILEAIEELESDYEDGDPADVAWIVGDQVETDEFTIVGKIENASFSLKSKYGTLDVALSEVEHGSRDWGMRQAVSKKFKLSETNFAQRSVVSSKIKVARGDMIRIKAEGTLLLEPWDESTTPEGNTDYGSFQGHPMGSLLMRVGKGEWVKVGSEGKFVAPRDGEIQLAIAMMDQMVNSGYDFPGEYQVRVRVEPR